MKKIIYCSLILALISGCQKKPVEQYTYTVSQEMQDYFNWKEGSYWVFTDSLTGKRDSLAVNGVTAIQDSTSDGTAYTDISIYIYEYYDTFAVRKVWEIFLPARGVNEASLNYYNQGYFSDGTQLLRYNISPFNIAGGNSVLSQVSIGPSTYMNVLSCAMQNDRILLNADSGFIKMTLNNPYTQKVLVLQKSHIVH